jgi:CRP-like cAMP-binding protein
VLARRRTSDEHMVFSPGRGVHAVKDSGRQLTFTPLEGSSLPPAEDYPAGVELTSQGTPSRYVYFIETGGVKLVHTYREGREIILDLKFGGTLVGASSALLSEPCTSAAITMVRSRLVRWGTREFSAQVEGNHSFSRFVNSILSRETQRLCTRLAILGYGCARTKLLYFLNEHAVSQQTSRMGVWKALHLPLTQRELAEMLAMSPFHLSKVYGALERDGLIRRAKGRLYIDRTSVAHELHIVRQKAIAKLAPN